MDPLAPAPVEALVARAASEPGALAYACGSERATYGELAPSVADRAARLAAAGVRRGDRVALVLGTSLDTVRVLLAVQWLGAAPVVVSPHLPPAAIRRRLEQVRCRLALASLPGVSRVGGEALAPDALPAGGPPRPPVASAPSDTAFLQLTSGTTGEPRAAILTYRSLARYLGTMWRRMDVGDGDVLVSWLPLHHDMGLVLFVLGAVVFGRPAHLLEPSLRRLDLWLETLARERGTITASPDLGYRIAARMAPRRPFDLGALRFAIDGGEPVRLSTVRRFEARFGLDRVVRPGYGLAEATLGVSGYRVGEPLRCDGGAVACGRPLEGLEVRIAGCGPGEAGDIEVRGPQVFEGYFGDAEATREVLGDDGWLRTGDRGRMDADGYLYVLGRRRAMVKRGGESIAPAEVERAVEELAGVRSSAAVGCGGPERTEELVVVVEVEGGTPPTAALSREVVQRVRDAVGSPPTRVLLVHPRTIPRTHNGKTRYDALRGLVEGGLAAPELLLDSRA